jgi:hypothetical protein
MKRRKGRRSRNQAREILKRRFHRETKTKRTRTQEIKAERIVHTRHTEPEGELALLERGSENFDLSAKFLRQSSRLEGCEMTKVVLHPDSISSLLASIFLAASFVGSLYIWKIPSDKTRFLSSSS